MTGVAATSAPWLLTTAVLVTLRVAARGQADAGFGVIEPIVTIVYAITIVLSAPVHVVVSRYAADRLYDRHLERIAAPLRRALALTLVGFGALAPVVMALCGVPLAVAVPGAFLFVVVGAQWLMLSVGSGMSSPGVVVRAFGVGAPLSVIGALTLQRGMHLGAAGYLYGFCVGQIATLALLLHAVLRALPERSDESARLGPAFVEYKLLAASSLAYHASIWLDKVVVWLCAGKAAAILYATASTLAWFSVIPSFAWIYVQVETGFYRRFRAFYGALLAGASLPELREESRRIGLETFRILRGAAIVQALVSVLAALAAPKILAALELPAEALLPFRLVVAGAALQILTLLGMLVLYYFDLRRDATVVSLALLVGNGVLTFLAWWGGLPPSVGYAASAAVACGIALMLVRRSLGSLLIDTFQSQPYGAEL
jgi:uncharacterized membrane protein